MNEIAFYLNNKTMKNQDYSSIIGGNPGLPGSEYEFLLIPFLLEERKKVEPYLLVNFEGNFPHKNVVKIKTLDDCCQWCENNDVKILVVDIKYIDLKLFEKYHHLSFVIWAHNNVGYSLLKKISKLSNIKRIVNCGREQMELYRDHIASLKSTYIYNIFPFKTKEYYQSKIDFTDNHNVVYMGSMVKTKGFHILAKAWKQVLSEIPDANLYVIGSGTLYNSEAKLGKYGIAEEAYESQFIPYLTNKKGDLLPSVHFMGLLKEEKYDVMGKCKVAVPNPSGLSECLPITSIEMQLMGCNIVTIQHAAFYDTVFNKNFLYKNERSLTNFIVKRLVSKRDDYEDLYTFVTSNFGINENIDRWEDIVINIENNPELENISQYHIQNKKLKNKILHLKIKFSILNCIPCIEQIYMFINRFKKK